MSTAEQYRARAIEYSKLLRIANGPTELREYQRLERSFVDLAANAQWVTDNHDKTAHMTEHGERLTADQYNYPFHFCLPVYFDHSSCGGADILRTA